VHRNALRAGAAAAIAMIVGAVGFHANPATAVETDMAVSTTAIDFGALHVASTASVGVTLTNTGGDPFGPINIFGGAPPTAEFNASQNCQGTTLPAGGSCNVNYSFTPSSTGSFNDTSSFTISETNSQSDGEDFSVTLTGSGVDPNATTTTAAPTTTTTAPPAATPTNPPAPGNQGGGANTPGPIGNTPAPPGAAPTTTAAPNAALEATVEHEKAAPGQEQRATVKGYKPGETVTATEEPDRRALGAAVADESGAAEFEWIISVEDTLGSHEFIATGAESGAVSVRYTVVATPEEAEESDDSGLSPWLIALIVLVVVGAITAGVVVAYRRGRSAGGPGDAAPEPPGPSGPEAPEPPEPDAPTEPVRTV
jgi:hypothetical protein